jgi:hypothetical protein
VGGGVMATKYLSIGSQENVISYDDSDTYADAVNLVAFRGDKIRCEDAPVNPEDVVRLAELGTVFAPVGAQYVTLATDANLTNERVLTGGSGIDLTDGGAGSTITLDFGNLTADWNTGAFNINLNGDLMGKNRAKQYFYSGF